MHFKCMKKTILALSLLTVSSFTFASEAPGLEHLKMWMQGGFDSSKQAEQSESYFNIHLYMKEIWVGKTESVFLYVEQAADGYLDQPYRQRIYELKQHSDTAFESITYTFENPMQYAGAWKTSSPLSDLSPSSLEVRKGCSVFLDWNEEKQAYVGATRANECESSLRGASYATSEVSIFSDRIESWDKGFDASDKQVWGAEQGGYVFNRQSERE